MTLHTFYLGLFVVSAASGCINRELVLKTRAELDRASRAIRRHEGSPAPSDPLPAPWSRGQFALWSITDGDDVTLTLAEVLEAEPQAAIAQVITVSPRVRTSARVTFQRQPRNFDEARELLTQIIRQRGDERPLTYRFHADMPVDVRDALAPLWATLVPHVVPGQAQTGSALAATMEGCVPSEGPFVYSPVSLTLKGLSHPKVPINGLLRGSSDTGQTVELIDFGWQSGAPAL